MKSPLALFVCILFASAVQGPSAPPTTRYQFREPHGTAYRVEVDPASLGGNGARPEWVKAWREDGSTNHIEFGSRVVLQLVDGRALKSLIAQRPLKLAREVTKNLFILQAPDAIVAAQQAQELAKQSGVLAAYPSYRDAAALNGGYAPFPNDKYYYLYTGGQFFQWYLESRNPNTEQSAGFDFNARSAWAYTRGAGVTIAVADTGIQITHPDLSDRVVGTPHHNFFDGTANPAPYVPNRTGAHGTAVSGLAAATMNNKIGMAGMAPEASLASWVIFTTNNLLVSDEQLMEMFQYASNTVAVQNHSWSKNVLTQTAPSVLEQAGLSNALTLGRNGRGVVMVRAAGNDRFDNANTGDDLYRSDPRVVTVAAIRQDGRVASYSVAGASLLVAAPGGDTDTNSIFTTDLTGTNGMNSIASFPPFQDIWDYVYAPYPNGFVGTSASSPLIAGVAALILSANTNLTARDVQHILILSSRHFDLADPDLRTNGAGLRVSHNLGFGVPDAGWAVNLARSWSNRPPLTHINAVATNSAAIPDDGLRLVVSSPDVPDNLLSIRSLAGTGPHPDSPTINAPLVYVGLATNPISINLVGKGALIQRGTNNYADKIAFAAQAGAAFAIIYNYDPGHTGSDCPGGDEFCLMGGTDFSSIPSVFIGYTDGEALRALFETNSAALAQLSLNATNYSFNITNTLICEHVGVRIKTDHPLRGDVRITLLSPQGTRSVLQTYNFDTNAGPADWTYYSTHHFYESSAGNWTVSLSDEYAENTGSAQYVELKIEGVPIVDTDGDGLDDGWETVQFGSLAFGPKDDPDGDGYSNAREQIMGTNPLLADVSFRLSLASQRTGRYRLSWPSVESKHYQVWTGTNLLSLTMAADVPGRFPETEWTAPVGSFTNRFFQVRAIGP